MFPGFFSDILTVLALLGAGFVLYGLPRKNYESQGRQLVQFNLYLLLVGIFSTIMGSVWSNFLFAALLGSLAITIHLCQRGQDVREGVILETHALVRHVLSLVDRTGAEAVEDKSQGKDAKGGEAGKKIG